MSTQKSGNNATLEKSKDGQLKMVGAEDRKEKQEQKSEQKMSDSNEKKRDQVPNGQEEEERPKKAPKKEEEIEPIKDKSLQPGKSDLDQDEEGEFEILEQGVLYFFYRPKVQSADDAEKDGKAAGSIDDVQNTHLLLVPAKSQSSTAPASSTGKSRSNGNSSYSATTGEKARKEGVGFRLIRLGKKRMPAPEEAIEKGLEPGGIGGDSSETIWSVISDIGPDVNELAGDLGEKRYNTKTRGERYVGGSRLAGRGRYAILFHSLSPPSRSNVRLTYALSHPNEIGDVQKQLGITLSASVRLSMRNPTLPQTGDGAPPAGLPKEDRVEMSAKELKDAFGGKADQGGIRYTDPKNIEWLDREGVELLMIRERHQSKKEGAHTGASEDQANALESKGKEEGKSMKIDDVMNELQLSNRQNPPDAMEGAWI